MRMGEAEALSREWGARRRVKKRCAATRGNERLQEMAIASEALW